MEELVREEVEELVRETREDSDIEPEPEIEVDPVNHSTETSIIEVGSSDEVRDKTAARIRFQQAGGPCIRIDMYYGWMDRVEQNEWINDDMIMFMCQRMAQVIPYSRLRLLSSHFFDTCILKGKTAFWKFFQPVVCLPICVNSHWVLVAIVTQLDSTTVFYFDSLNRKNAVKKSAKQVAGFLRAAGLKTVAEKAIKVPVQENGIDCGLHVISHFLTIVSIMDKNDDDKIAKVISKHKFNSVIERKDLKEEIEDAFSETLYHKAYWGKYALDKGTQLWWPCRRISVRFAKRLSGSQRQPKKVPVIWFKKEKDDSIWVFPNHLEPLFAFSLEEMIQKCTFIDDEEALLRLAYEQASQ